jgi:hypothetical protein
VLEETLNPVVAPQPVIHPPSDYRNGGNGAVQPTEDHADIPTEETPPVVAEPRT